MIKFVEKKVKNPVLKDFLPKMMKKIPSDRENLMNLLKFAKLSEII